MADPLTEKVEVTVPAEARSSAEPEESPTDTESQVGAMIEEALRFYEEELEPQQTRATDYYMGRLSGDLRDEQGRSQVVSTDVRDTTQSFQSQLLRIFFGPDKVVEFRPRGPEDVESAEQATDYINYIIKEDNPGFLLHLYWFKDSLVRKVGIAKWWWEDREETITEEYTGLNEAQLFTLSQQGDVKITKQEEIDGVTFYDVKVTFTDDQSTARIDAIPNEEFLYSPNARTLKDARLVAHQREMRADELVSMGYDEKQIQHAKGVRRGMSDDDLDFARRIDEGSRRHFEDEQPDETRPVLFTEAYVYIDDDGDGEAELRRIRLIGEDYKIGIKDGKEDNEEVDERPFALFLFDPEPHTMIGLSLADYTMDSQLKKSAMERGALDSLAQTLDPSVGFLEGLVNPKDLVNPERSRLVRVRREAGSVANAVQQLTTPFVGEAALAMLEYENTQIEERTGRSRAAAGLNADALQSSTRTAVAATVSGSMQRVELVARIFAETGLKTLYKGLLRLVHKHQNQPRIIRLRNKFVAMDPSKWNPTMDVMTTVALGAGLTEERLEILKEILANQMEQLQQGSPLVTLVEVRKTLAKILELSGHKNVDDFYRPFGEEEMQMMQMQAAQQPPPPDPQQQIIQLQAEQLRQQGEKDAAEQDRKQTEMILENDRERDKMAQDFTIKQAELEAKYKTTIDVEMLRAETQRQRQALDADLKRLAAAQPTNRRRNVTFDRNEEGRIAGATIEEGLTDGQ